MNEPEATASSVKLPLLTYPVLLETVEGGFIARVVGISACRAIGTTPQEALIRLKQQLCKGVRENEVARGELTQLQADWPQDSEHPWMQFAGMFKDDPLFEDCMADVAAYRQADREVYFHELDAQPADELESENATRKTA